MGGALRGQGVRVTLSYDKGEDDMSGHEITIGDASVTFEQVEVDLDYYDILENIEDTIA